MKENTFGKKKKTNMKLIYQLQRNEIFEFISVVVSMYHLLEKNSERF